MNPEDMVLLPSRGDELCAYCHDPIVGEYTHITEDGVDIVACVSCAIDDLIAAVTQ